MAVLQLRLYVAQCDTYALADETLNTLQDGETFTLHFHNGRLVKQPGYEIFLTDVDDAVFIREGDAYYLQWQREGRRWQAKISE